MSDEVLIQVHNRVHEDLAFLKRLVESPVQTLREYDLTEEEKQIFIIPQFSWLIENRLAGVSYPGSEDALVLLSKLGVKALVSLSEQSVGINRLTRHGLQAKHIPISDLTAPTLSQVEQAIASIDDFLAQDQPVAVHCFVGLGRTGTILACYLVSRGSSARQAIEQVRTRRPGSIETPEQEAVVELYERHRAG